MMKVLLKLWIMSCLFLFAVVARAGILTGELDQSSGTVDDQFVYTLTVQGSVKGDPKFPTIEGLEVQTSGTSQNVSIVNGQMTRELQYQFVITPRKPGQYTIPPIFLEVDGEKLQTLALPLRIVASQMPGGGDRQDNPEVFVEREVSQNSPFVGEQITSTVRIYHRVPLLQANVEPHAAAAIRRIPVDGERESQKVIKGEKYRVIEIQEILVPSEAGTITLEPFDLNVVMQDQREARQRRRGMFDDFFNQGRRIQKRFHSNEISLNVKPLPNEGRHSDFSGLVGQFKLQGNISDSTVKTGDSTTLTLTVSGHGLVEGMTDPVLKLPSSVKTYPDKPSDRQQMNGIDGIHSERTFKYALVPQTPGELYLGTAELQVFDPSTQKYVTLSYDLGKLTATGAAVKSQQSDDAAKLTANSLPQKTEPQSTEVKTLNEDLLGLHQGDVWKEVDRWTTEDTSRAAIVLVMGGLFLSAGLGVRLYQNLWRYGSTERRKAGAKGRYLKRMKNRNPVENELQVLGENFKVYLEERLDLHVRSLTGREIASALKSQGISEELTQGAVKLYERLDQQLYGEGRISNEDVDSLRVVVDQIVNEVEKHA